VVFPTVSFVLFFPVVLILSWLLMSRPRIWKPFILASSYVFYSAADPRFCLLLAAVTLFNQAAAKLVFRWREDAQRTKQVIAVAVTVDLLVLGVFKYYGFFTQQIASLFESFGLGAPMPLLEFVLPVGISFFTFQAISYAVDVRRGLIEPAPLIDFALYLSFFPHLVAGPIVRAREFLPQLKTPRDPSQVAVGAGIVLVGLGLIKKVLIADTLARLVVDPAFGAPELYSAPDIAFASYAYAAQIYCDFSGYTDMAIGLALLMGFVFPQNFDHPYRSRSFQEFWRRWHITLSRYLRDFLYIPLGGNRGGEAKRARNLFLTMLLGGLWHGAAWTFVLWGALHGTGLVVERFLRVHLPERVSLPGWARWFIVFHLVVFGWILFRSPDLSVVAAFLGQLTDFHAPQLLSTVPVLLTVGVIATQLLPRAPMRALRLRFEALHPVTLGGGLAATILIVGAAIPSEAVPPFIYFQF
jgi:D-alanyl-lipoteichoic acid acyltransferase DltB (MBOAT superfamily)